MGSTSSSEVHVTMMQSPKERECDNVTFLAVFSLANSTQVSFVQYDDPVKTFTTDRSDDTFHISVLPRRCRSRFDISAPKCGNSPFHGIFIFGIAVGTVKKSTSAMASYFNNVILFHGGVSFLVGLLLGNNISTRYAAFIQLP
jgi:hypothetical protein